MKQVDLVSSLLTDLGTYLQDTLQVGVLTQTLFLGSLPPDPDKAIAIIALGGPRLLTDTDAVKRPQIQILIRDLSFLAGLSIAEVIYSGIDNKPNILSEKNKGWLIADHVPGPHYKDANKFFVLTLSFTARMDLQV